MKKLFIISLALTLSVGFTSCKKEPIAEPITATQPVQEIRIYGEWVLIGGEMYMENMDTHQKTKYNHFDATKNTSSLRYEGSMYPIETIVKDSTTWSIYPPYGVPGTGKFYLNHDTLNSYGFYVTNSNWTIVESPTATSSTMQMGGSSRPIQTRLEDLDQKIIGVIIQNGVTSISGENYTYFSELHFKKTVEW